MNELPPPLILASQSPRRRQLLDEAGFSFEVIAPDDSVEKGICSNCGPDQLVVDAAVAKATAIAQEIDHGIILGADTVASCKAEILGKPVDVDHARAMLKLMGGTVHQVLTGVCLWHRPSNQFVTHLQSTTVEMDKLSDQRIEDYLDTDQWIDKAGAFGYQDGLDFVRILQGLESTVVGLPVENIQSWIDDLMIKVNLKAN
jgi:septum formation protein